MPQQSWNKILDLRVTGTWIRKKRVEVGSCLQWSQVQINYCDKTRLHNSHAGPGTLLLPQQVLAEGALSRFPMQMPSPKAKTWERKRDGMNILRNSAEKIPPFFMAPLFLMLKETERLGCLKWNSLGEETQRRVSDTRLINVSRALAGPHHCTASTGKQHVPTYLGGMFSGLLDQSDTQSTLFFRASTSFSPSATSSSDCRGECTL